MRWGNYLHQKKSGPCKMVGPVLEELSDEMAGSVVIAKHNIDDAPNTPTKYGVRGIPTMLLFKSGEVVDTKVGAATKDAIKEWLSSKVG
jgi:thioredoxin 1